ncbi:hypothetical protein [Micromonospora sp. KLBMP9576]|uniref:hypothetical protein n=1 Tax=Micromonospora sp. KLBMP9576 TaxID=3424769 RepID=UPI003D93043E
MFFRRAGRPGDRAASDRLLDTARAAATRTADGEPGPLARVLSAAAGPARPGELAGEEAAVAAFRAARAVRPAVGPAPSPRRRRFTAGAAAWGAAIAVTATAGASFAAVALNGADEPVPPSRPAATAPTATAPATTAPDDRQPERGGSTATTGGGRATGTPSAASTASTSGTPGPDTTAGVAPTTPGQRAEQLRGLCRAYLARKPAQRVEALDTPSFARLVTAAGGPGQVEDFCRELVPEVPPPAPTG